MCMKDISRELLQAFVARKATLLSAKSVRNLIALLGEMWVQARADGYTLIDPFVSLVLPDPDLINERCLTLDEMRVVIDSAAEPYKTYYWILAETGIRCGEACGLPERNLLLDTGAIKVDRKGLAREDRNGEVEKGQSSLRNFSATRGASSRIPSHLATEPARIAFCHGQRNAVGRGSRSEACAATRPEWSCGLLARPLST
jgi:integrase